MIGRVCVEGGGTADATATAGQILAGYTAYAKGEKIIGSMPNLTANASIEHAVGNCTKVIPCDAHFISTNTDGVTRYQLRYNGQSGYITPNTLFGFPYESVKEAIGGLRLNIFTQLNEPATKDGIWIQTASKYQRIVNDTQNILYGSGTWQVLPDLPFECWGTYGVITYRNEMHVFGYHGGNNHGHAYGRFHYKFNGNTWTRLTDPPEDFRLGRTVVVFQDAIWFTYGNRLFRYDGNSWTLIATYNYDQFYGVRNLIVYNGRLCAAYIDHRDSGIAYLNTDGTYEHLAGFLDDSLTSAIVLLHNGNIHAIGLSTGKQHFIYNGTEFVRLADLPFSAYITESHTVIYNNDIHFLGTSTKTAHYKYDGYTWTSVSTLPFSMSGARAAVLGNKIYILGISEDYYYGNGPYRFASYTTPENVFQPHTIILKRGDHNGAYLTAIADTSCIQGPHNRWLSGFDDVWYFGATAFEMAAPMYYGDGTRWIKFKN